MLRKLTVIVALGAALAVSTAADARGGGGRGGGGWRLGPWRRLGLWRRLIGVATATAAGAAMAAVAYWGGDYWPYDDYDSSYNYPYY